MDKPLGQLSPPRRALGSNAARLGSPGFGMLVSGIAVIIAVAGILTGHFTARKPPIAEMSAPTSQTIAGTSYVAVDDAGAKNVFGARYSYAGRWEHVQGQYDGRSHGTSSRSFTPGATATLRYTGTNVNLYGVTGPTGGAATVRIDGASRGMLQFYSPQKGAGTLIFSSGPLAQGAHNVEIIVATPVNVTHRYVNLDGAIYTSR